MLPSRQTVEIIKLFIKEGAYFMPRNISPIEKLRAIKEEHGEHFYPIQALCKLGSISRAAYYKWLNHEVSENEQENHGLRS